MFNTNNLNGGLYPLHTHLNHCCAPNAASHDVLGRLDKLTGFITCEIQLTLVIAKQEIKPGEEVMISYVNPSWPVGLRKEFLQREYGFECNCARCIEEMKVPQTDGGQNELSETEKRE